MITTISAGAPVEIDCERLKPRRYGLLSPSAR